MALFGGAAVITDQQGWAAILLSDETLMQINIETPTVNAGIRGTEINMKVTPDQTVSITILEGEVLAENKFGSTNGLPGEIITALPGKAPFKTILVQPDDAVQWTITIPPGLYDNMEKPADNDNMWITDV